MARIGWQQKLLVCHFGTRKTDNAVQLIPRTPHMKFCEVHLQVIPKPVR